MNASVTTPKGPFVGRATVVIVGGGHAGLAMSRALTERAIDHVILERGEVANSWRRERWDSLRLLTPNWLTRLPGYRYSGADPDGFMETAQVIQFIENYARLIDAPIHTGTTVQWAQPTDDGYRVVTDRGTWRCRALVLASGAFSIPCVPKHAAGVPDAVVQVTSNVYKRPDQLPDGGVLVVGGSSTGLQLADELNRSGRRVTLSIGEHVRMPRTYRGLDIQYWMKSTGLLDETWQDVDDVVRARKVPSPQLVGTPERSTLDLNALTDRGVELVGRFAGLNDGKAQFSGSLKNLCAMADLKLGRLLDNVDQWADEAGLSAVVDGAERFEPTRVPDSPRLAMDLGSGEIRTIVWATGFRPDYSWLGVPGAFDARGRLAHDGGVVSAPGLYVLGLTFMRRRKSSFIHGAENDVRDLAMHLGEYLAGDRRYASMPEAIAV
jgi:putative flavoprotein involved in K+ transport